MDFTQPKLKVHLMGPRHLCPTYWTRRFQCLSGRDPFNQNFRKFPSKTQWIGSVQPEKFRRNGPPFKVDQFSRSDRLEFWLNGPRPLFYFFLPFYLAILSVSSDTCKLKQGIQYSVAIQLSWLACPPSFVASHWIAETPCHSTSIPVTSLPFFYHALPISSLAFQGVHNLLLAVSLPTLPLKLALLSTMSLYLLNCYLKRTLHKKGRIMNKIRLHNMDSGVRGSQSFFNIPVPLIKLCMFSYLSFPRKSCP